MDVAAQRRRLVITLAVNGVCAIIALAALIASFAFHATGAMIFFGFALAGGFGTQIWLIWGFARIKS